MLPVAGSLALGKCYGPNKATRSGSGISRISSSGKALSITRHRSSRSCRMGLGRVVCATAEHDSTEHKKKRVVVTGMGVCTCYGNDVDDFYDNLLA